MEYKYKLSEKLLQCYSSIYCLKLRKSRGESPHCFMILLNCIFKVQTINKLNPFEKKNKNYLDLENTEQTMTQDSLT